MSNITIENAIDLVGESDCYTAFLYSTGSVMSDNQIRALSHFTDNEIYIMANAYLKADLPKEAIA